MHSKPWRASWPLALVLAATLVRPAALHNGTKEIGDGKTPSQNARNKHPSGHACMLACVWCCDPHAPCCSTASRSLVELTVPKSNHQLAAGTHTCFTMLESSSGQGWRKDKAVSTCSRPHPTAGCQPCPFVSFMRVKSWTRGCAGGSVHTLAACAQACAATNRWAQQPHARFSTLNARATRAMHRQRSSSRPHTNPNSSHALAAVLA